MTFRPSLVKSGLQTGVDRAAIDVALDLGIPIGECWVPKGKIAEDGVIPERYWPFLKETFSTGYEQRTLLNVTHSIATLILVPRFVTPGSARTLRLAQQLGRPHRLLFMGWPESCPITEAEMWLDEVRPEILNIAGSRESKQPGIYEETKAFLREVWKGE